MAKKIECDRCGKLVESKGQFKSEVSTVTMSYIEKHDDTGSYKYVIPENDRKEVTITKDFCSSCQKKLLDLFNLVDENF